MMMVSLLLCIWRWRWTHSVCDLFSKVFPTFLLLLLLLLLLYKKLNYKIYYIMCICVCVSFLIFFISSLKLCRFSTQDGEFNYRKFIMYAEWINMDFASSKGKYMIYLKWKQFFCFFFFYIKHYFCTYINWNTRYWKNTRWRWFLWYITIKFFQFKIPTYRV